MIMRILTHNSLLQIIENALKVDDEPLDHLEHVIDVGRQPEISEVGSRV